MSSQRLQYISKFALSLTKVCDFFSLKPPEAAQPWDDVLTADRLPDACPQAWGGILALTHPHWFRFNEDCLYVNVFAPNVSISYNKVFIPYITQFEEKITKI